jgi:hypothetical protein
MDHRLWLYKNDRIVPVYAEKSIFADFQEVMEDAVHFALSNEKEGNESVLPLCLHVS